MSEKPFLLWLTNYIITGGKPAPIGTAPPKGTEPAKGTPPPITEGIISTTGPPCTLR
eukprot:NODE_926_length_553_cov_246.823944_g916_i0.p1 GENE.NODE_926_length_553_cov_246.823944_g916_i0~~NODE_926_length_553_cov_246.823944_g916_i0.p1  ORF type:complete len:57 (+),score=14.47 NODE_926_length_553_cov_246.823944_g916_i0:379-549(+)